MDAISLAGPSLAPVAATWAAVGADANSALTEMMRVGPPARDSDEVAIAKLLESSSLDPGARGQVASATNAASNTTFARDAIDQWIQRERKRREEEEKQARAIAMLRGPQTAAPAVQPAAADNGTGSGTGGEQGPPLAAAAGQSRMVADVYRTASAPVPMEGASARVA